MLAIRAPGEVSTGGGEQVHSGEGQAAGEEGAEGPDAIEGPMGHQEAAQQGVTRPPTSPKVRAGMAAEAEAAS